MIMASIGKKLMLPMIALAHVPNKDYCSHSNNPKDKTNCTILNNNLIT